MEQTDGRTDGQDPWCGLYRLQPNRYPPSVSDLKLTCLPNPFCDYSVDWTSPNLPLVDLAVVCTVLLNYATLKIPDWLIDWLIQDGRITILNFALVCSGCWRCLGLPRPGTLLSGHAAAYNNFRTKIFARYLLQFERPSYAKIVKIAAAKRGVFAPKMSPKCVWAECDLLWVDPLSSIAFS